MIARFLWKTWLRPILGSEFIGTTAAIIGGLAAAGSSIAGGAMASSAANKAAKAQADAANQAAQLQHEDAQAALDFQKQQYGDTLRFLSPYYNTGTAALGNLGFLMGLRVPNTVLTPGGPAVPQPAQLGGAGFMSPEQRSQFLSGIHPMSNGMPMAVGTDIGRAKVPLSGAATNAAPLRGDEGPEFFPLSGDMPDNAPGFSGPPDPGGFSGPTHMVPSAGGGVDPVTGLPTDTSFLVQPDDPSGFGSLMAPWTETFEAPTDVTEQNDPGFQFRLKQGQDALERSAAARGSLLTGGTAKDLTNYAQDYASNEYNNVYNRLLNQYVQRYNIFKQNQNDQYNRLASLAGLGQTTAGQLSSAGQNMANNAGSILMNSGQQIGNDIQNAAFQRGSGYVNSANIWNNTLGGLGNLGVLSYLMTKKGS